MQKNRSLGFEIVISFVFVILIMLIVLIISNRQSIRDFFTEEIFRTIENYQEIIFKYDNIEVENYNFKLIKPTRMQEIRNVNNIFILDKNIILGQRKLSEDIEEKMKSNVLNQKNVSKRYVLKIDNYKKIFYVIKKFEYKGKEAILISYMWDTYKKNLEKELSEKLIIGLFFSILIAFIFSIILSKRLSKPIIKLQKNVEDISNRKWDKPVLIDRNDEIGRLAESIEIMRKKLIEYDDMEQKNLQHISHELKTPVMVIRSYIQSIEDGIYPDGDLESSMKIIDNEAKYLEKRIKWLLYLTKLEYLSNHVKELQKVKIDLLLEEVVKRFKFANNNIEWVLSVEESVLHGNQEQLIVVFENIFENQLRYANTKIIISGKIKNDYYQISIFNDGEKIEEDILKNIFNEFIKGKKGNIGIGMSVVKKIIELHNGKIDVFNKKDGVEFIIKIPVK